MSALCVLACGWPGPLNLLVSVLAVIACAVVALLLIAAACVLAWQRRPRKAAAAVLALAVPVLMVAPLALMGPYVHLWLTVTFGIGYIGPAPSAGQPVAIYDWSTGMVGGPNSFLIHDPTDAMARPQSKNAPPEWRNNDFLRECSGKSQRLIGHYYICTD